MSSWSSSIRIFSTPMFGVLLVPFPLELEWCLQSAATVSTTPSCPMLPGDPPSHYRISHSPHHYRFSLARPVISFAVFNSLGFCHREQRINWALEMFYNIISYAKPRCHFLNVIYAPIDTIFHIAVLRIVIIFVALFILL